jgi:membrane-associated phospholipid phosphatase
VGSIEGVWYQKGGVSIGLHTAWQRFVERTFFRGSRSAWSERAGYWIGNAAVIFGLSFVLVQLFLYRWTGRLHAEGEGYRLDFVFGGIDNRIPFVPQMAILYLYLYYPWKFLTMLYFTFVAYRGGCAVGFALFGIGVVSTLVYIFFPVSVFQWRLELLSDPMVSSFWARNMYRYYELDTSFNCFPSLHAATSTAVAYAWFRYWRCRPSPARMSVALVSLFLAAGVVLSTLFVKQHYIVDEIAGIVLGWTVSWAIYRGLWRCNLVNDGL